MATPKKPNLNVFSPEADNALEAVKAIAEDGSTVGKTLKKQLDEEFNRLLVELQKEYPLSAEVWQDALEELERLKKNDRLFTKNPVVKNQKNDSELVKKVRVLLASYGIDPEVVEIRIANDPDNLSYASAGQYAIDDRIEHFIDLNPAQMNLQNSASQEALLRHEIMHLINYDPITFGILEMLFTINNITQKEFWKNPVYRKLNKLSEYRADLMAAVSGDCTDVAQALIQGFQDHIRIYDDFSESNSTHPTCQQRCAVLGKLVQYMEAEKQMKIG